MTTTESSTRPDVRTVAKRGGIATLLSLVVNLVIVWAVTTTGAVQPFRPLAYPQVAILTALGAIGATIVYGLLVRWSGRPQRTFAIAAGIVLLVSFIPDVTFLPTLPGSTTGAIVVLMAMHVTVAAICYVVLTRPI